MDKIEAQILNLIQHDSKSADKMTAGLKFVGNGSMEDGIRRLAAFFYASGYGKGEQAGIMKGVGGTLGAITAALLIYQLVQHIRQKMQKQKELEKEGKEIIASLESISDNAAEEESRICQEETHDVKIRMEVK